MSNNDAPKPSKRFYVYTLADDSVFYVGKGTQRRMHHHENEARSGCTCQKCERIRSVWERGHTVIKSIVFETQDESEALHHERDLIASLGRSNLCNRTNGGEGKSNSPVAAIYEMCKREIIAIRKKARGTVDQERYILLREAYEKSKRLEEWYQAIKEFHQQMRAYYAEQGKDYDPNMHKRNPW